MVKVFFNNSCNICRAEINHYKKHSDNRFKIKPLFFILNIFYEIAAYFLFIKNKHLLNDEKN